MNDPRYEKEVEHKECPECKGECVIPELSNCCGELLDPDTKICTKCNEPSFPMDCIECLGSGEVEKDSEDFTDLQDALLDKADEKYDEFKLED